MKKENVIKDVTVGTLNALVKNIMRQTEVDDAGEAIRLVNSGDYVVMLPPLLSENDGMIKCSVVSDGTTPLDWHARLKKNFQIGYNAGLVLSDNRVQSFIPTNGIATTVVILKGKLFRRKDRTFNNVKEFATERNMLTPNAEISCLLRENLTNDEIIAMGLRTIIIMHEPLMAPHVFGNNTYFSPYYLDICVDSAEHGGYLSDRKADDNNPLSDDCGFAFIMQS